MKRLLLIALVACLPAFAHADLVTETTGPLSQTVDSASGNSFQQVVLPAFDQGLGSLTGATISITANVAGTITEYGAPIQQPATVPAEVTLAFISNNAVSFQAQTIEVQTIDNAANVSAVFTNTFAAASLASFLAPDDNFFIPAPDIFIQALAGADTQSTTTIDFDITEALTYMPVPEPSSIALFAVCFVVMGAVARRA
jgi:hypothetical protein